MRTLGVIPGDTLNPDHPGLSSADTYFMAETHGLCTAWAYHKHKIVLFLAAMRHHRDTLRNNGETVTYYELTDTPYEELLKQTIIDQDIDKVLTYEPKDKSFSAVRQACQATQTEVEYVDNPNMLTGREAFSAYTEDNPYHHATFYKWQRRRLNILVDDGAPENGKWSFDQDNRKPLNDPSQTPSLPSIEHGDHVKRVKAVVAATFPDHPGSVENFWLPVTHSGAQRWYQAFLNKRFDRFGPYQDAINESETFAYHAAISPLLNIGLLNPGDVVDQAVAHYHEHNTHYPSVEGFIRQIIGWREFIHGIHHRENLADENYFDNTNRLNQAWYDGSTGLPPVDDAINQINQVGYAHHIQRLMVLSNAMLLCEIRPGDVHTWFMEQFVDSAEWVMEANVYDMGQYATGGLFATKPYISSSNYITKMSDYDDGDWTDKWDALYWSFLDKHYDQLQDNHRMGLMLSHVDRKTNEELNALHEQADAVKDRLTA
jgi:deoxyribodipyrimidine photolyase-related protein